MSTPKSISIGLVGARGYVGKDLVKILARHPHVSIAFVSSRTSAGKPVAEALEGAPPGLLFEDLGPGQIAERAVDAVVLALPNDHAAPYVTAIDRVRPSTAIIDVSSDHRFDDAWAYGMPELVVAGKRLRAGLAGAKRISNPGCHATAAALAVAPVRDLLDGPANAFSLSGYSGAGTTPSPRNDVDGLRDNPLPYSLVGHLHEREVTRHAGPVFLAPHVAQFFRGITATVSLRFREPITTDALAALYTRAYEGERLVRVVDGVPRVRDIVDQPHAAIGGFAADPERRHAVVVVVLDNLLKGAASQAVQNLNLSFGFPELTALDPWPN